MFLAVVSERARLHDILLPVYNQQCVEGHYKAKQRKELDRTATKPWRSNILAKVVVYEA